jgi:hypothetical protein
MLPHENPVSIYDVIAKTHMALRKEKKREFPRSIQEIQESLVGCTEKESAQEVALAFIKKYG